MRVLSLATVILPLLVAATPVPVPEPEPVGNTAFATYPVNIVMLAGAAQFGMWAPHDGVIYSTGSLTCLNALANSYGSCATPSFNAVGVVAGNGPCTVWGKNGFSKTLTGAAGEGFAAIAPPQQLTWISCGP